MNRREGTKFRRRVIEALFSVVVLAVVSAIGAAVLSSAEKPGFEKFRSMPVIETGINSSSGTLGFADSDLYGMSSDDINHTYDLMRQTGVSSVRLLFPWAFMEPNRDQFDWGKADELVNGALAHGLSVLACMTSSPGWASPPNLLVPYSGRPDSAADYGNFAGTVADRYRGRVSGYEIWNEANSVLGWTPNPDPAAYTELLKAAYPKIKAADPGATVLGAGLAPVFSFGSLTLNPAEFVKGMYAAGAKGNFDALAYHPYLYTMKFSGGRGMPEAPITQVTGMHDAMAANGDGAKKVWATEYGEPTSSVDEATQADYIRDFITTWRTLPFGGPVYIYTTRDRNTGSGNDQDTFGVYRTDWTPKPAQQVVQSLATHA